MRYAEIVNESPQMIAATDSGLSDPLKNRSVRSSIIASMPDVLERTDDYEIVITDRNGSGRIALIEKADGWMAYFVEYELSKSFVGTAVTQVSLWRDDASRYVQGITKKMFFEVLLPRFKIIMSDAQQTEAGKSFWRQRLADAANLNLKIGLADLANGRIDWREPAADFRTWITSNDGWGSTPDFQNKRYVISSQ